MSIGPITLLMFALLQAQHAHSEPVPIFFGPIPSVEGFIASTRGVEDSYRDLREEFERNVQFKETIRVVSDPSEARLILEITARGLADTGARTGTAVATGRSTAVGSTAPVRTRQLWARLAVGGTSFRLDIDGAAGIRLRTYRNQAKNVLRQVVDWVEANRSMLANQ